MKATSQEKRKRNRLPNLTHDEKQKIIEDYREDILKIKQIAWKYRRAPGTINVIVSEYGIPKRKPFIHRRKIKCRSD